MSGALTGRRVAVLERARPVHTPGRLVDELVPALVRAGARVDVVRAEQGRHRLDQRPDWDVVVLKSGSAAALHLAAAAEAWGVPSVNTVQSTRLAQDKVASMLLLASRGLPVPACRAVWGHGQRGAGQGAESESSTPGSPPAPVAVPGREVVVKAGRGSGGEGVWRTDAALVGSLLARVPPGPYLVMDHVAHDGDDLKVYLAGEWVRGVLRPYPARTAAQKDGQRVAVPPEALRVARDVGEHLGLTCFGCDFVDGPSGWVLVDVNAFPGYKGADGAAEAVVETVKAGLR